MVQIVTVYPGVDGESRLFDVSTDRPEASISQGRAEWQHSSLSTLRQFPLQSIDSHQAGLDART